MQREQQSKLKSVLDMFEEQQGRQSGCGGVSKFEQVRNEISGGWAQQGGCQITEGLGGHFQDLGSRLSQEAVGVFKAEEQHNLPFVLTGIFFAVFETRQK